MILETDLKSHADAGIQVAAMTSGNSVEGLAKHGGCGVDIPLASRERSNGKDCGIRHMIREYYRNYKL